MRDRAHAPVRSAAQLDAVARHAVELSGTPDGRVRAVTHLDVSRDGIDSALLAARDSLLP